MKLYYHLATIAATAIPFLQMDAENIIPGHYIENAITRRAVEKHAIPYSHIDRESTDNFSAASTKVNPVADFRFAEQFHAPARVAMAPGKGKEKMDSVVRHTLENVPVSKQEFAYNEAGLPLRCFNYVPNPNGGWMSHSRYVYEYDDINRLIARERVNEYDPSESVRYEYFYEDATPYYTSQIVYLPSDKDWMPYQRVAYKYDDKHNTIEELYAAWSEADGAWVDMLRTESSYDAMNRMTSYFQYACDLSSGMWYGYNPDGNNDGQRFYYTEDGKDAMIANFDWEDGAWLEYKHETFTYDDNGNLTRDAFEYWNRKKQDWSGYDKYGPGNIIETNYRLDYTYDDLNRCVQLDVHDTNKNGVEEHTYIMKYEYSNLEDGNLFRKGSEYVRWKNTGLPELSKVDEQTFNSFGNEIHYLQYSYNIVPDVRINKTEEFRHYDEKGRFTGAEYYSFIQDENANTRYGDIREEFFYNDPDPEAGYTEGHRYLGTSFQSDNAWAMSNSFYYSWENGVLVSRTAKNVTDNGEIRCDGYDIEYDFTVDMADVIWWSASGKGADFENNKTLSSIQYYNYSNDDVWDQSRSYKDVYSYSEFAQASIETADINTDRVEIARYNADGILLNAPAKGLNIIRYSDGSVAKQIL